jgi:hypothetical protein
MVIDQMAHEIGHALSIVTDYGGYGGEGHFQTDQGLRAETTAKLVEVLGTDETAQGTFEYEPVNGLWRNEILEECGQGFRVARRMNCPARKADQAVAVLTDGLYCAPDQFMSEGIFDRFYEKTNCPHR